MNILVLNRDAHIGGGNTYMRTVIPGLEGLGHRVDMMTGLGPYRQVFRELCSGRVWLNLPGSVGVPWQLPGLLRRRAIDVVNAHSLTSATAALPVCQRVNVPLVFHVHGQINLDKAAPVLQGAAAVIVVDETLRQWVGQVSGVLEKTALAHLPVDPTRYAEASAVAPAQFRIAYVARLSKRKAKAAFALIEAVEQLAQEIPGLGLTIVGGRSQLGKVRARARAANAAVGYEAVRVQGPSLDVQRVYREVAVVVGTSFVTLEGLASARYAIATGVAGLVGFIDEASVPAARAINFGDRGAKIADPETADYVAEVRKAYAAWQASPRCAWGPDLIAREFGVSTAVADLDRIFRGVAVGRAGDVPA